MNISHGRNAGQALCGDVMVNFGFLGISVGGCSGLGIVSKNCREVGLLGVE